MKNTSFKNESHQDWCTPDWLFWKLDKLYNFEADGASHWGNALKLKCFTKENNEFLPNLNIKLFINPPWGELSQDKWWEWASKNTSIMLVPFTPETKMWHKYVWPNASVFIFNKRINYKHLITKIETKGIARPSALICYNLPTINMPDLGVWIKRV